ncbi:MAG: SAM-dependent methyltransferase, partial [Comamonas sp.]
AKYGKLGSDWREDMRQGFAECFRVLRPNGTLVFKWNETQIKVRELLALTPEKPLYGQVSGRTGMTHWLVFIKPMVQAE